MLTLIIAAVLLAFTVNADPRPQASPTSSGAAFPTLGQSPVPVGPKPTGCSDFEILVARGTSEPGPFGGIVGDPLVSNVAKMVPGSRGYAVQYPADRSNQSVSTGAKDVVMRLMSQDKACPNQKFAIVGYSQGARVLRTAAPEIPEAVQRDKIMAVVMFGDPGLKARAGAMAMSLPPALQSKLFENCAVGDPVCSEGTSFGPHLTYNDPGTMYQMDSANFIRSAFMGMPMPAKTTGPAVTPMPPMSMPMPSMSMPMPSMSMTMTNGMTMTMTSKPSSTMPANGTEMSGASARFERGGLWLLCAIVVMATSSLYLS